MTLKLRHKAPVVFAAALAMTAASGAAAFALVATHDGGGTGVGNTLPIDDNHATTTRAPEPGDDNGGRGEVEPGDDHDGHRGSDDAGSHSGSSGKGGSDDGGSHGGGSDDSGGHGSDG